MSKSFKVGDTVIALSDYSKEITKGKRYIVIQVAHDYFRFIDNKDNSNWWWYSNFKLCEANDDFNNTLEGILK